MKKNKKFYEDASCIILSGGKSSRMGKNKSLLRVGDVTLIELTFKKVEELFKNVILVTNEPEIYHLINCRKVEDIYKERGPLGGIHSGLFHSTSVRNFIISCDMPFVTTDVIKFIVDYQSEADIILPEEKGRIQTLCGIYNKSLLKKIEEKLSSNIDTEIKSGSLSVNKFVKENNSYLIDFEKEYSGNNEELFFNINTADDFQDLLKRKKIKPGI